MNIRTEFSLVGSGSYSKIQFLKDATENSNIVYLVLVKQGIFELLEFVILEVWDCISNIYPQIKTKKVKISQDIFRWHTIHNVYLQTQVPLLIK